MTAGANFTEEGAKIAACHPSKSPFADTDNPLLQGIDAMGPERARELLTLLRELVGHLPDGERILKQVSTWVRSHSGSESHPPDHC